MGHSHEFTWASSVPNTVVVTGTFDDWKETCHLQKDASGRFSATVDLPYGSKVLFKYIVDGNWSHNPREPCESDESGFVNNVLHIPTEEQVKAEEQKAKDEAERKAEEERKTVEAQQAAAAHAQTESARRGSVTSNKSAATTGEPSLRDVAKETAVEIKDEVSVIAAGAAVAAGAAFQHAFSAVSSAVRRASLTTPADQTATLPGEKPVDPTPTPAVPRSGSALSSAFSGEKLAGAIDDAKAASGSTQPPVVPLVPEVPKENIVASQSTSATSGEAIGTVLPVVPEPPSTTVVPTATTSSLPTATSLANNPTVASATTTVQNAATDVKNAVVAAVADIRESLPATSTTAKSGETTENMPAAISYPMAAFASVSAAATAGAAAVTAALSDTGNKTAQLYTEGTMDKSVLSGKEEVKEIKAEHSNADIAHKTSIVEAVKSEVDTVPAVTDEKHKTDVVKDIQAHVPTAAAVDAKTTNGISPSSVEPAPAIPAPAPSSALTNGTSELSGKSEVVAIKEDHPKAEVSKKTELVNAVKSAVTETPAATTSTATPKKSSSVSKASSKILTQADNSKTGISTKGGNDPKSKRYSTLGRKDSAPAEPPVTPKKTTASTNSTPATGGRDAYTTAPSTPSSTPQGRERKSSFFQKVKSALSPHSKK